MITLRLVALGMLTLSAVMNFIVFYWGDDLRWINRISALVMSLVSVVVFLRVWYDR